MSIFLHRLGVMGLGVTPLTEINVENDTSSVTSTVGLPSGALAGDVLFLFDYAVNATATVPSAALPSGFVEVHSISGTVGGRGYRVTISYIVYDGVATTFTGMSATNMRKILADARADLPIASVSIFSVNAGALTDSAPSPLVIEGDSAPVPCIIFAGFGALTAGSISNAAITPGFDSGTGYSNGSVAADLRWVEYVIDDDPPEDNTASMDDSGNANAIIGCCLGFFA